MLRVSEHLRAHLLASLGVPEGPRRPMPDLDLLSVTEWSPEFERLCRNRLIVGAFRYGRLGGPDKWRAAGGRRHDLIGGARMKLDLYEQTGNQEHLVDLANYALLEFVHPSRPGAYFHAEDDQRHCPVAAKRSL